MRDVLALVAALLAAACGPTHSGNGGGGDAGGDATFHPIDAFAGPFPDFPASPILDGTAPANSGTLFGAGGSGTGAGPCVVEPEAGTLYPNNWLRPRFTWVAGGGENLFELSLAAANEANPLVVYTTNTTFTLPAAMWTALAQHVVDQPITVTVRGAVFDVSSGALTSGPDAGTVGTFSIAPAAAPGAIVYWTTSDGTLLRGFHIGDETVADVATPADAGTACIGCHSSTPDGQFVGFSASANAGNGDPATIGMLTADGTHAAPHVSSRASAQQLLARQDQELPVYSAAHWLDGDRAVVDMFPVNGRFEIVWTDLEAASTAEGAGWGVIARTGDANPAAYASFAHTSDTLLYVSSPSVTTGVTVTGGDLATVPYAARAGGGVDGDRGRRHAGRQRVLPDVLARRSLRRVQPRADRAVELQQRQRRGVRDPGRRRHAGAARGERSAELRRPGQPGRDEQLAEVGAGHDRRERQALLLADVQLDARRRQPAALRDRGRRRRHDGDVVSGAVPVEPAGRREQPHAGVGQLRDPDPVAARALLQVREQERPLVGELVEVLHARRAEAVAGVVIDAQQHRLAARRRVL